MSRRRHTGGFTLLELLVALAVTAGIAVLAWQFIDGAIRASEQGTDVLREVDELERFWQAFDMDLQHSRAPFLVVEATEEAAPVAAGTVMLAFAGGEGLAERILVAPTEADAKAWLYLLRDTGEHPGLPLRPALQRVLYSLHEGRLLRESWPEHYLPAAREQQGVRELVRGIEGLSIRFLALRANDWSTTWPVPVPAATGVDPATQGPLASLPLAISLTLYTEALGDVERVFVLPGS